MKKILGTALIIILVASLCSTTVLAASDTYYLDELELEVTIPDGYYVITRDTSANDPVFEELGTTKSTILDLFETSSIYLNAISDTYNEEIVVTMIESTVTDFYLLGDTTLDTMFSLVAAQYSDYGINALDHEIYTPEQGKFIKIYFTDTDHTVYGLQYYTVYDGKAINFTMRSYDGAITSRQATIIKQIVDSIKYDKPLITEPTEKTSAFVYSDTETGMTFTVPANWNEKPFSEEREFIDVKFVSTTDSGCTIIYGSTDVWSQMSASEKIGLERSEIDNSVLTKADVAEMCGTTADKISVVTYNGVQYYKGEMKKSVDAYGVGIPVTMTQLVYINDGWMYSFQFGGTSSHTLYSDFESLLRSVQYSAEGSPKKSDSPDTSEVLGSGSAIFSIMLVVILAVGTIVSTLVVIKNKREKQESLSNYKSEDVKPASPNPSNNEKAHYCHRCGAALASDSVFCHVCGTRVRTE